MKENNGFINKEAYKEYLQKELIALQGIETRNKQSQRNVAVELAKLEDKEVKTKLTL